MPDLEAVHDRLRAILDPYRDGLAVTRDGPGGMALEVPGLEGKPWGYVAGTRLGHRPGLRFYPGRQSFPADGPAFTARANSLTRSTDSSTLRRRPRANAAS